MKKIYLSILAMAFFAIQSLNAQIWINEIHYDNSGATDIDEGFEIAGVSGTDLSCYSVLLYNGSNNNFYDSIPLTGLIDDEGCSYGAVWFGLAANGMQNGAPDGIGLYNHCTATQIKFLSYEGTMTAANGPFVGVLSEDIGVSETNSDPAGTSLFLTGVGTQYTDFTWVKDSVNSNGVLNVNQDICTSILPHVYFKTDSFEFNEGAGTVSLDTLLISPALVSPAMTDQFEIHLKAGSTATVADFDVTGLPIPITFPQTVPLGLFNFTAQALDVTIIDDALIEGSEWVAIVLRNAVGLNIGADSVIYLKIIDNDFPMDTFVELTSMTATVGEGDGTYNIALDYQQTGVNPSHTVDLQLITGDVADINNYTTQTVTFNTLSKSVTITITDDLLVEPTETLTFALVNATNGLMIGSDSIFTLNITNNDVATYDLGLIDGNNATGGDSTGLHGKFVGVVNSLDRGFTGSEFSIQSATGSVDVVTSATGAFASLAPAVGDELEIEGTLTFVNGMVRIESLVSATTLSSGNAVVPEVVSALSDANESTLVRMNGLTLVNPAQWIAAGGAGFDVQALKANGDTVVIRIDRDYLALYNSTAPNSGMIDVVGVSSQFDATTPYDKFRQLIPRDLNDIILYPTLNFAAQGTSVNEDAGTVTVNFAVANDNGGSYTVDVALTSGDAADLGGFANLTAVAITGGVGSFTVNVTDDAIIEATENFIFTVSNPSAGLLLGAGKTFDLTVTDNDANGIKDINVNDLRVYPNPTSHTLKLDFISNEAQISTIQIVKIAGQVVATKTVILNYGQNNMTFDVSKFAKGNYVVNIATEAGKHAVNIQVK